MLGGQERVIRISVDGTPLLGRRTGVGRYVHELLHALTELPGAAEDEVSVTAFTLRGRGELPAVVPPGTTTRAYPMPARLLRTAWSRWEWPPVTWLAGRSDLFHGTNFVLPPPGNRAHGVVTVHDLAYLHFRDTVDRTSAAYRELVPRSIGRAAQILVPSAAVAAELQDAYGLAEERVTVTPLGVHESWFTTAALTVAERAHWGLPDDYLLAVGTIEPRKGLPQLLDAYRQMVRGGGLHPRLVLVGPQGWGETLDLTGFPDGSVTLTGFLGDTDLQRVVASARALVFPSRYEGFGLPPLEALACGVPVIATDLPVTREVLGDSARFVTSTDELRQALDDAAADRLPGDPDGRRAHARTFTWRRCATATRTAYAAALS